MKFEYGNLTVVGFNGTVEGDCGYAVAVARYDGTDEYAGKYLKLAFPAAELELLDGSREPGNKVPAAAAYEPADRPSLFDESAIKAYEERGRLTLFRNKLRFRARHNAMVVYVTQRMLDTARSERRPPVLEKIFRENLKEEPQWELLSEVPEKVWATCVSLDAAFLLIDHWCGALQHECIGRLIEFIESGEKDREVLGEAEAIVEMALTAARGGALREELFLLYSVVLTYTSPLMVKNIFEMGLLPEFKKSEWNQALFDQLRQELLNRFHERARARAAAEAAVGPGESTLVGRILAHPGKRPTEDLMSRVAQSIAEVGRIRREPERFNKAKECAEYCMRSFKPDPGADKELLEELRQRKVVIKVEKEERLKIFASDPIFYLLPRAARFEETREVDFLAFLELVRYHMDGYRRVWEGKDNQLANYALEEAKNIPELIGAVVAG